MNKVERILNRSHKTLHQACVEAGIEFEDGMSTPSLESCANCGIWHTLGKMKKDLDNDVICAVCRLYYGE